MATHKQKRAHHSPESEADTGDFLKTALASPTLQSRPVQHKRNAEV